MPIHAGVINLLLKGKTITADKLLGGPAEPRSPILNMVRKSQKNLEEKGLTTLYLTLGSATWPADDGGRDPKAPIVMLPLTVKRKGPDISTFEVRVSGDATINPVLLHVLSRQFNSRIRPEDFS